MKPENLDKYVIGLDYGTLSARAVLVCVGSGEVIAESVYPYPNGIYTNGIYPNRMHPVRMYPHETNSHRILDNLPETEMKLPVDFALQEIDDYVEVMYHTIGEVVEKSGCRPENVIGIGIDATSSTFLPVLANGEPLCKTERFRTNPHAWLKLWKHHGAQKEADCITELAKKRNEKFLMRCGGRVNAEWMLPKLMEIVRKAPDVYEMTDNFMEVSDYLVYLLTGEVTRCMCHAGYKLLWNEEDGYPSEDFLKELHPGLSNLKVKLKGREVQVGECAGRLTQEAARRMGLKAGTAVAASMIDAHVAVPSAGIDGSEKALMILGTSCCMLLCSEKLSYIQGISGCVKNAVLPGLYAYEAGQSAVGDLFDWFVKTSVPGSYEKEAADLGISVHTLLSEKAAHLAPGESGLIALDWWNGNRSCLADSKLSGMILGFTLRTKPEDIYRALLEATAFGMRAIFEEFEKGGIIAKELYACGGIVSKNPFMMQIYADILGKTILTSSTNQGSAFGASIYAAVAAGNDAGGYLSVGEAARAMGNIGEKKYDPIPCNVEAYNMLYKEYKILHNYFGSGGNEVMHRLK
ncbi:ribulokinase [bacterium 1xD42-62]|uniref:Ribulokinase n=2 Tax=Parablautia muri TaxID=2320879 RepID=A0A9X5BJN1_9FIRM|nr:ribulokinase [Parablautia muri]